MKPSDVLNSRWLERFMEYALVGLLITIALLFVAYTTAITIWLIAGARP